MRFKLLVSLIWLICTYCSSKSGAGNTTGELAAAINKKCPKMIDSETRLDKVDFKEPNTITYHYTLINLLKQNVDTAQFYQALWPGLISFIKVGSEMKSLRDSQGTVEYCYKDRDGLDIYCFKIGPKNYNQN